MPQPYKFHKTTRLKDFNYSSPGSYFVTIVVADRDDSLGSISDCKICLSNIGKIADEGWRWLGLKYPYVGVDSYVIMPNHLHGIITISALSTEETNRTLTIGQLVGAFKTRTTSEINRLRQTPGQKFWQDDFHDRIIRDEREYQNIQRYIQDNPTAWANDRENPDRITD